MSTEYKVGYAKPPKEGQFKPGKSGNPKGRPKGTQNFATDLAEELAEKVKVTEGSKPKKISKQRAMVKSLVAKALRGDVRAVQILVRQILAIEEKNLANGALEDLSCEDSEILAAFQDRILGKSTAETEGSSDEG